MVAVGCAQAARGVAAVGDLAAAVGCSEREGGQCGQGGQATESLQPFLGSCAARYWSNVSTPAPRTGHSLSHTLMIRRRSATDVAIFTGSALLPLAVRAMELALKLVVAEN